MGQPIKTAPVTAGGFFESVSLTFAGADTLWLVRTLIVLGTGALGLILANAWCRYACPAGGLLEMLRSISIFEVYKTDSCNACDKCIKICHMGTYPAESNCTNCLDCISICPQNAIKIGRRGKT